MKIQKKHEPKGDYLSRICEKCNEPLVSPYDMIIYDTEDDTVCRISFRHSGRGCDDKSFANSRPVMNGYDDILERWQFSRFNKDSLNHPANKKAKQKRIAELKEELEYLTK